MAKGYATTFVAVDGVIFTIRDRSLEVYLRLREKEPFQGKHELIGGLLLPDETAEMTMHRKLTQMGLGRIFLEQFHTFTDPSRDPRSRAVSIGFIALVSCAAIPDPSDWHCADRLPTLGFDHKEIILAAREHLRKNVDSTIVRQFMPSRFPLNLLQEVYEVIEQKSYDNRNFRKRMITSGLVRQTDESEAGVTHRPAKLFEFA